MALVILRCVFILVAASIGVSIVNSKSFPEGNSPLVWIVFIGTIFAAMAIIGLDSFVRKKRIETISAIYFGLLIGLLLTYVFGIVLSPLLENIEDLTKREVYQTFFQLILGSLLCYTCISLLIQTKDDFRFIIPYVEFAKEVKGVKPFILDTSAVIDGRIADVLETHVIDNQLIMPRFVLGELQHIADSNDRLRRGRGRRGLDILNRLRSAKNVDFQIHDRELTEMEDQAVDMKLVLLAKHLGGKLVTGDYNLNKIAKLHNVQVINLNDLSNALKPVFLPGESVEVRLVKAGEEAEQGVGYLEDGTMIVVEGGRPHVGKQVIISVTSVLQTSAGRMIFGKFQASKEDASQSGEVKA